MTREDAFKKWNRNLYYQPNEVVFREAAHNHEGDTYPTQFDEQGNPIPGDVISLKQFISQTGGVADKNEHHLYFVETRVCDERVGDNLSTGKSTPIVVMFKGNRPVSVDYKYVANAPKVKVNESYDIEFDALFSSYNYR